MSQENVDLVLGVIPPPEADLALLVRVGATASGQTVAPVGDL
jgi:hypothetical protein